jgi:hypothetical protein
LNLLPLHPFPQLPTISAPAALSFAEGDSGLTPAVVTVTLSAAAVRVEEGAVGVAGRGGGGAQALDGFAARPAPLPFGALPTRRALRSPPVRVLP